MFQVSSSDAGDLAQNQPNIQAHLVYLETVLGMYSYEIWFLQEGGRRAFHVEVCLLPPCNKVSSNPPLLS